MQIKANEFGKILAWKSEDTSCVSGVEDSELLEWIDVDPPDDFEANWTYYIYNANGTFTLDCDAVEKLEHEQLLFDLRVRRENECFSFINRGQLWYDMLTSEQKEELKGWYQAWLDVTDTLIVPDMPDWL